jgi:hypothetical protein
LMEISCASNSRLNNVTMLFFDSLFDDRMIINSTLRAPAQNRVERL